MTILNNDNINGLKNGEYKIVAESNQMKKHHKHDYERSVILKGYGYINITAPGTYTTDTIVVYDENQSENTGAVIEGKVTSEGIKNNSEVILTDIFQNEIARTTTKSNGKYKFVNVSDGMYFITAISDSDGMGRISLVVVGRKVYGDTNITIHKSEKIKNFEQYIKDNIPHCDNREDALIYKDKILDAKTSYDKLSDKEKEQLSKEYLDRLNKLLEWISQTEYETNDDNVKIEGGGLLTNKDNIESNDTVQININIDKKEGKTIDSDGVKTDDDFIRQIIEDNAKDKGIGQYYDISMKKGTNGKYKDVDDIHKDTDTTGSLQITMPIPEEYKGHKHYSFVHVHNGEATTLVDLDANPDTVTFKANKFSTFVLCYSDEEVAEIIPDDEPILNLSSSQVSATKVTESCELILASYNGTTLVDTKIISIDSDVTLTISELEDFTTKDATVIKAFLWRGLENLIPLCDSVGVNLTTE